MRSDLDHSPRDRSRREDAKAAALARKAARKGKCARQFLYFARPGELGGEAQ